MGEHIAVEEPSQTRACLVNYIDQRAVRLGGADSERLIGEQQGAEFRAIVVRDARSQVQRCAPVRSSVDCREDALEGPIRALDEHPDVDGRFLRPCENLAHHAAQRVASGAAAMVAKQHPRYLRLLGAAHDIRRGNFGVHRLRLHRKAAITRVFARGCKRGRLQGRRYARPGATACHRRAMRPHDGQYAGRRLRLRIAGGERNCHQRRDALRVRNRGQDSTSRTLHRMEHTRS